MEFANKPTDDVILGDLKHIYGLAKYCMDNENDASMTDFANIMIFEFRKLGEKIESILHNWYNPLHNRFESNDYKMASQLLFSLRFIEKAMVNFHAYPTERDRQIVESEFLQTSYKQLFYEQHVEHAFKQICCAFDWMKNKMDGEVKDVLEPTAENATAV